MAGRKYATAAPGSNQAAARIAKVLGKAVHPAAIDRLLELWPEAVVRVQYHDGRYDGVDSKVTRVFIYRDQAAALSTQLSKVTAAFAEARCRLDHDVWVRRRGIRLAFTRALKRVPR